MNQTARNLAALMAAHDNLSANDLALATEVPQPTISRILNGESEDPRDKTLRPMAKFFGLTVHQIKSTPTSKIVALAAGHVAPQAVTPDEVVPDRGQELLQLFAAMGTLMRWLAVTRPVEAPLLRAGLQELATSIGRHGSRERLDLLISVLPAEVVPFPVRSGQ